MFHNCVRCGAVLTPDGKCPRCDRPGVLAALVMMVVYVGVLYAGAFLVRAISGGE